MFFGHSINWIIPLVIVGTSNVVVHWLLARRLRQAFPAVWLQLGSPDFSFRPTSIRESWRQQKMEYRHLRFIWSGEHLALQDSTVTRLVWCARVGVGLAIIFFVLCLVEEDCGFHS